jgi:hypothetical protein
MIKRIIAITLLMMSAGVLPATAQWGQITRARLPQDLKDLLANSRYVYISSLRENRTFGKPAEIWFLLHDDAVWVGTPPESWRAKRIKAGRATAKIAVGSADGPVFYARGKIVQDPKVEELLFQTFAKKYPEGWPKHEEGFRKGFADGSRILIRYSPIIIGGGARVTDPSSQQPTPK